MTMNKDNLKILIKDLEFALQELKAEVYSDTESYLDKEDVRRVRNEKMTTEKQTDYENPWIFDGHPFLSEDIDDHFGFVYCITNLLNGKRYIGRKYFHQLRKPRTGGRRVKSESDWKKYYSSAELTAERKKVGNLAFRRTIY